MAFLDLAHFSSLAADQRTEALFDSSLREAALGEADARDTNNTVQHTNSDMRP
jgi:hypothetical protein